MQSTRFFAGIFGALLGVTIQCLLPLPWLVIMGCFIVCSVLCGCGLALRRELPIILTCGIALMACTLGFARAGFVSRALPQAFEPLIGAKTSLEGVIVSDPDERETSSRIVIEIESPEAGRVTRTNVLAVVPRYPEVALGEQVRVTGTPERPKPFDGDGGRTFAYDDFLAKDGIFLTVPRASLTVLGPRQGFVMHVLGALADTKRAFVRALEVAIPEPAASLAVGITAGGKQGLGTELLDDFTTAGLLQLVVLSGYNVMIVAEAILVSLRFLPRGTRLVIAALGIIAFVLAAGSGTSAVRAGIMACIGLFARATGRKYAVLRALLIALVAMVFVNPLLLLYDPGLQLSVMATIGLILGTPFVEPRLAWIRSAFFRDIIATSIAAQIVVLPLLLYLSGNLSLVALPANVLTTPVIPLAMALSFGASIVAFVMPSVAPLAGFPAFVVLTYVIDVARIAARLPFAQIIVPAFPAWMMVATYGVLGAFAYRYRKRSAPG